MYKQRNNNGHSRHNGHSSSFGGRNTQRGGRGFGKKLDPKLFIRKASDIVALTAEEIDNSVSFNDYNIDEKLKRNIAEHGYTTPTPIQLKAIPEILSGRDIIGMANTGTGKTAAFLITLINKAYLDHNQKVLIVAPTRELVVQIVDEFRVFAKGTGLEAVATIGGVNIKRQMHDLSHHPHFVVGTPGRLKDLIERRKLNLGIFQNIVLDEVDRMVDIGFIREIRYLISLLPKKRQSLFFSATVDAKTNEILQSFVNNPVTVSVKQQDTSENIDQDIVKITGRQTKIDVLHDLLVQPGFDKVLIFGRTKWGMEKLSKSLAERGFKTAAIHGNKSQGQRQRALEDFKNDRLQVLIATDVASRGIDIDNVTHVINYDAPMSYEDYIHRIGRTGRAGKKGTALTFVD